MEKTDFSHVDGSVQDRYMMQDSATGKLVNVRDTTDAQLLTAIQHANTALSQAQQQYQVAFNQVNGLNGTLQVLQYEADRRARSLAIAHTLPLNG